MIYGSVNYKADCSQSLNVIHVNNESIYLIVQVKLWNESECITYSLIVYIILY